MNEKTYNTDIQNKIDRLTVARDTLNQVVDNRLYNQVCDEIARLEALQKEE